MCLGDTACKAVLAGVQCTRWVARALIAHHTCQSAFTAQTIITPLPCNGTCRICSPVPRLPYKVNSHNLHFTTSYLALHSTPCAPPPQVTIKGCTGPVNTFVIEPFVPHKEEFYLCIQSNRLDIEVQAYHAPSTLLAVAVTWWAVRTTIGLFAAMCCSIVAHCAWPGSRPAYVANSMCCFRPCQQ